MSTIDSISAATTFRSEALRPADRRPPVEVHPPDEPVDTVDLSERARLLDALRSRPDYRPDVISRVRGEIEAGSYLTDEKLDTALDALIDDVLG
jgi:hypothetical protein